MDSVGGQALVSAVEAVLLRLKEAQFVRETDEGWKLQTAQEKNWEEEKAKYSSVRRSDRSEILRRITQAAVAKRSARSRTA